MAITITPVLAGKFTYIADVSSSDGTDLTSGDITHGLGGTPNDVRICITSADAAADAQWAVTTINSTKLVVTCDAAAHAAPCSFRIIAKREHSVFK